MFQPDCPYDRGGRDPQSIRDDFWDLTRGEGFDPDTILDKLANFLPADTLAEFLDDFAMGRI